MPKEAVKKLTADFAGVARIAAGSDDFPHKWTHVTRDFNKRAALLEAQNHRCAYCGVRFGDPAHFNSEATIDHYAARAHGGKAVWSNETMACRNCNEGRGDLPAMLYFLKVQEIGRYAAYGWASKRRSQIDRANNSGRRR